MTMILLLTCIMSWNLKCNSVIVYGTFVKQAQKLTVSTLICVLFKPVYSNDIDASLLRVPNFLTCIVAFISYFRSLLALDSQYFDHSQNWVFIWDRLLSLTNSVNFRVNPWLAWFFLQTNAYASETNRRKTLLFAVNKRTNLGSHLAENFRILLAL